MAANWKAWESLADWWQEGFTNGVDPEYEEQLLPLITGWLSDCHRVVDVGCGEGQVSRAASRLEGMTSVVGLDPTWAQVSVAAQRGGVFGRAEAAALPVAGGSVDAVVACLVFEHIEDVDTAISEVSRILRPGGRFVFLLNHPLLQTPGSGWIDDTILEEQYWRIGPYLVENHGMEEIEKGVLVPFIHRPLSRYMNAMASVGLLVTRMEEPPPPPGFLARSAEYRDARTIPRLLALRAEKVGR